MTKNLLVEILLILCLSLLTAFLVNGVRQDGIPLVGDYSRYEKKAAAAGAVNSEGFVAPVQIQLAVAKSLHDQGALFIDARDAAEFAAGHISGAHNIPYHQFHELATGARAAAIARLAADRQAPLVCYCNGGECDVSIDLAYDIARTGYRQVSIYLGGYAEWQTAGYPVTTTKR